METTSNQLPSNSGDQPAEAGASIEWRRVPGYDEFEVNELGEIREDGGPARLRVDNHGYIYVLRRHSRPALLVHRAVLLAFVGPPEPGQICRHRDDNPSNNKRLNLLWGTKKQNAEDRVANRPTRDPSWTSERRLLERIKALEDENSRLRITNMRFKAAIYNFIADPSSIRMSESLKKELEL